MSASYPYKMTSFPQPGLEAYSAATLEMDVTVSNPQDATKTANLIFTFDTGASISLAPRSLATQLGLVWESGIPLTLQGVGGSTFDTRVHVIKAVVQGNVLNFPSGILRERLQNTRAVAYWKSIQQARGNDIEFDLPIAIASGEDFELLFGMFGTIDQISEFRCDNNAKRLFFTQGQKMALLAGLGILRRR